MRLSRRQRVRRMPSPSCLEQPRPAHRLQRRLRRTSATAPEHSTPVPRGRWILDPLRRIHRWPCPIPHDHRCSAHRRQPINRHPRPIPHRSRSLIPRRHPSLIPRRHPSLIPHPHLPLSRPPLRRPSRCRLSPIGVRSLARLSWFGRLGATPPVRAPWSSTGNTSLRTLTLCSQKLAGFVQVFGSDSARELRTSRPSG